jgi:hypothetical protein
MHKRKLNTDNQKSKKHKVAIDTDTIENFDKNTIKPKDFMKLLKKIYINVDTIANNQNILNELRQVNNLKKSLKNIVNKFPLVVFSPNVIAKSDVKIIKNFMKQTDVFNSDGDKRDYYFSESYITLNQKSKSNFKITSIFDKDVNSPTILIDQIIHKLCNSFLDELKKINVNVDPINKQFNVFLAEGKINNDLNNSHHVRWHRDSDTDLSQTPEYSMVVLLDEKNWSGGDFCCQYIGKNTNPYGKKKINAPIIKLEPQYCGAIILKNDDTRHMVTKIESIESNENKTTSRSVLVIQLYMNQYSQKA